MGKWVVMFVLSTAAIVFYYEYNFNDFMIEMGSRKKCGEEYITGSSSFIYKILPLRRISPEDSWPSMIKRYVVNLRQWKGLGDVKDYLIENGFDCTANEGRSCIWERDLYLIQSRQCVTKKYTDLSIYKDRVKIKLSFHNNNVNDIAVDYNVSQLEN